MWTSPPYTASEVHMLVGQNGAGKSTLIKILCGAYVRTVEIFLLNGSPTVSNPREMHGAWVLLSSFRSSLSSLTSILLRTFFWEGSFRDDSRNNRPRRSTWKRDDSRPAGDGSRHPYPSAPTWRCAATMVEIAKAMSQNASVLVMDEPTAAISDREIERLFEPFATSGRTALRSSTSPTGCVKYLSSEIGLPS